MAENVKENEIDKKVKGKNKAKGHKTRVVKAKKIEAKTPKESAKFDSTTNEQTEQKLQDFDKDISKAYINNSRPVIELVACLSYILFFLPLIFCKKEPFALFHANQSLILWIFAIVFYLAFAFIPNVNVVALPIIVIFHILGIFYGMYTSAHGKAKTLPLIGKITIIKWNG